MAEIVGSVDQVRETIELALLRQDNILWTSIAGNPTAWAELACRAHSTTIFREGACHLIGKWQSMSEQKKMDLRPEIRDICQKKYDEVRVAKEAIEMRILGHYPGFLCRTVTDRPGRPAYANDIYMWMAISFFRHWFAQAISDQRTREALDGGYAFYKALHDGGQAYLHHLDFQNFHSYFPMSAKACNVLEANMAILKEDVRSFVKDLMRNNVHVDPKEHDINWLTCAHLEKEDYPWYVPEDTPQMEEDVEPEPELVLPQSIPAPCAAKKGRAVHKSPAKRRVYSNGNNDSPRDGSTLDAGEEE